MVVRARTIGRSVRLGLLLAASTAAPARADEPAVAPATSGSPLPAASAAPLYRIATTADPQATIALSVGADNLAELTLVRSAPAPAGETLRLVLSQFWSADERPFAARVFLHDRPKENAAGGAFAIPEGSQVLPLVLSAPDLPPVGTWRGTLTLLPAAPAKPVPPIALTLTRARARPATLLVEGTPPPKVITLSALGATPEGSQISVTLRDLNGYGPVDGVRAVVESVAQAPDDGFDAGRQLSFWFDGAPVKDFLSWSPGAQKRSIAAGGQARLGIGFRELRAGDTTFTLRMRAANSADDDRQRLTLKLHVRHHWSWAVAVLLGGIVLSIISTQLVTALRRRAAVKRQVRELEAGWLRDEQELLPPLTWVRSVLAQALELSGKTPLWTGDEPDKLIASARAGLEVLREAREVRALFDDAGTMLRYHARCEVRRAVSSLGDAPVGPDTLGGMKGRLAEVKSWRAEPLAYWTDVKPFIQKLTTAVSVWASSATADDLATKTLLEERLKVLKAKLDSVDVTGKPELRESEAGLVEEIEDAYARLKVIWDHRERPEDVASLKRCVDKSLDDFFAAADDLDWAHLNRDQASLKIKPPSANLEALRTLTYSVVADDKHRDDRRLAELLNGFVFRYGVRFRWTFRLNPRFLGDSRLFEAVSQGPTVVQFAPARGDLDVSVRLEWKGQPASSPGLPRVENLRVAPSSLFGWARNLRTAGIISLSAATIVALVGGLTTSYLKNPSFGALQDYLTLFLLGVGADQAKNLLRSLPSAAESDAEGEAASAPKSGADEAAEPAATKPDPGETPEPAGTPAPKAGSPDEPKPAEKPAQT